MYHILHLGFCASDTFADIKQAQEKEDEEDVVGDITVSFTPGLSNIGQAMLDAKTRKEALANETVWEARQRKRKEKKR